jgi:hypothetical protein
MPPRPKSLTKQALALVACVLSAIPTSGFIQPLPEGAIHDWKQTFFVIPEARFTLPKCIAVDESFVVEGRDTIANTSVVIYLHQKQRAHREDMFFVGRSWTDARGDFKVGMRLDRSKLEGPHAITFSPLQKLRLSVEVEHGRARNTLFVDVCDRAEISQH